MEMPGASWAVIGSTASKTACGIASWMAFGWIGYGQTQHGADRADRADRAVN